MTNRAGRRARLYALAACAWLALAPGAARAQRPAADPVARCGAAGPGRAVRCLVDTVAPDVLEAALFADPRLAAAVMPIVADALMGDAPDPRVPAYVAAVARARTRRLTARGGWSDLEGEMCLRLQLVDAERFANDAPFRARVLTFLPQAFDSGASPALRDQLLYSINSIPAVAYADSEAIEWGWGAIARPSLPREMPYRRGALAYPDDAAGSIAASVFSFPGPFLEPADVARFMGALRRARPGRELVALVDLPMRTALTAAHAADGWTLVETHGRDFSPWPRDPFSVLRREDGGLTFLIRSNAQPRRGADNDMPLELIQGLPERLDAAWGRPAWTRSPVPFHNGQVLQMPDSAWISIHAVSARALEMLGWPSVPAESVSGADWQRYREAAMRAAAELSALYGRPVKFVHAMPEAIAPDTIASLAGGGGFDLDSIVTMLPAADGGLRALVGDVSLGAALLEQAPADEIAALARQYGLRDAPPEEMRRVLVSAQSRPRATGLARFLNDAAAHLQTQVAAVERVPLFFVPVAALADAGQLRHEDFLITWNNVVLETADGIRRAEGFASGLASGDRTAAAAFARGGYDMQYLPVLPHSVILNGGYRCASQHVRARGTSE